jgi:hypothetical protein
MAKTKRTGTVTRTSTTTPPAGVPVGAPLRSALTAGTEEPETAHAKLTNPHATGADRTPVLRAHLSASQQRLAHKKAHGKLPAPATKAVAKPEPATKASQATPSAAPKFGSPAWRAKYGKKKAAGTPAVTPPIQP